MSQAPRVPVWIRQFRHAKWHNVFDLVPNNEHLYPVALRSNWKPQFNDWNGRILLLAKDGCPTRVIQGRVNRGEPQPWRYGQRELGDEMGWKTNEKLYYFASRISGGKLYGSAAANMLYDDDRTSRQLYGFNAGQLQEFLKRVLAWVLESMPHIEWVACLGSEAWLLTCNTIGNPHSASPFKEHRDSHEPVSGIIGKKKISAFPLYHPAARRVDDLMEKGWREFRAALSTPRNALIDQESLPQPAIHVSTKGVYTPRSFARKHHRIVTATLPRRRCRVRFMIGDKLVHTSREYDSGNTWAKIITYARSKAGGAPASLPRAAAAVPQVLTAQGWVDSND